MTDAPGLPLPDRDCPALRRFWEAAARHELRMPRCSQCGTFSWYPEPECHACGGTAFDWPQLCGRGTVYSFVIVRRALHASFAPFVPYVSGIVTLDDAPGVRMVTRFLDADPDRIAIGQAVKVRFEDFGYPYQTAHVTGPFWEIDA